MKGRRPTPTHIKLVTGNPGKRKLNKREPRPKGALNYAPAWMNAEQKRTWRYAIKHAPAGLLKRLDKSMLTAWVVAEVLHRQAVEKIHEEGMVSKTSDGRLIRSPYPLIVNRQAQIMIKAACELGFTPGSRTRIELESQDDKSGGGWDALEP